MSATKATASRAIVCSLVRRRQVFGAQALLRYKLEGGSSCTTNTTHNEDARSWGTLQGRSIFEDSSGSLLRDGDDFDEGAAGFRRWLRPSDIAVVLNRTATTTKGDGGGVRLDLDIRRLEDKRWAQYTFR